MMFALRKIALCGRTGCGKSTLFATIARLYPISKGKILIDGKDIALLPLRRLRSKIQVVDQDAVLLKGSLQRNLLGTALQISGNGSEKTALPTSEQVWNVLEKVGLAKKVRDLPGRLDFEVEDGGANFSSGERQLVALARALLSTKNMSVLLCDEATAHIDLKTDEIIHDTLLNLEKTVIMICHRLQHIHRFDKVAVLDAGKVVEYGPPLKLLKQSNGHLRKLYDHANLQLPQDA